MIDSLKALLGDRDLREVIRGSSVSFGLSLAQMPLSFAFTLILSNLYGAKLLGEYALAITVASVFALLGQFGTATSAVRFIAEYSSRHRWPGARGAYRTLIRLVVPLSLVAAALMWLLSEPIGANLFGSRDLVPQMHVAALALTPYAVLQLNAAALRGRKHIADSMALRTVIPPALNICGLVILSIELTRSGMAPIYAYGITGVVGMAISQWAWWRRREDNARSATDPVLPIGELIRVSSSMFVTSSTLLVLGWTDLLMLGAFESEDQVGIYRVASRVAILASFALGAANSIAGPKFADLYYGDKHKDLRRIARFVSKGVFWVSLPMVAVFAVFGKPLLGLFGDEFVTGYGVLLVLGVGNLVNAACGSVGTLLDMTGNQGQYRNIMLAGGLLNVVLNLLLIPPFGALGAASATAVSTVVWNALASVSVRRRFGYWIGYYPGRGQ